MSDSRFILRGSLINMGGMLARIIFSVLIILLPRLFSQETFGMFISLQSLVLAGSQLIGLGLDQGMAWWIPQLRSENRFSSSMVWNGLLVVSAFSILTTVSAVSLFGLFHGMLPATLQEIPVLFFAICMAAVPANIAMNYSCGCLMGMRKPEYSAIYAQFLSVSLVPVIAIVLSFTDIAHALAWSLCISNWLCAIIVLWHLRRHIPPDPIAGFDWINHRLWAYSVPAAFYSFILNTFSRIDLWIVLWLIGPAYAAVYGVMQMLSGGIGKVCRSYSPLIVPVVSGMDKDARRQKLPEVFSYAVHMVSIIQFAVAAAMLFFPKEFLSISGRQYSVDIMPFLILIAYNMVGGYVWLCAQVILGAGRSGIVLVINIFILAMAITLNVLLIPVWGLKGAALSSLISIFVQGIIYVIIQTRLIGQWIFKPHVMFNAAWMTVVVISVVIMHSHIVSMPLLERALLFLSGMLLYVLWAWRDRKKMTPEQ
jgi:O-antigen/teichoic acid export membrane protein